LAGKEMTVDPSLDFEKRRNRPVKYDRNLMKTTVEAMKRIEAIRARRARDFYVERMAGRASVYAKEARAELARDIGMIRAPVAQKYATSMEDLADKKLLMARQAEAAAEREAEKQRELEREAGTGLTAAVAAMDAEATDEARDRESTRMSTRSSSRARTRKARAAAGLDGAL